MREWLVFDRPSDMFPWLAAGEMLHYMPACCCLWRANTHTYPKITPGPPCSSLGLSSGSRFPSTQTTNILLNPPCCDTSHQNEHLLMGWLQAPLVVWLCTGQYLFQAVQYFKGKVGQPASNLENSEVTLWPFTRYALLQLWLELGISF